MAYSTVTNGPFLQRYLVSSFPPYKGDWATTGYRSETKAEASTATKRKRPVDLQLLSSKTSYSRLSSTVTRGLGRTSNGSYLPISAYLGDCSTNPSDVQNQINSAAATAAGKLRARIKDQKWNAAQTFAELGKTSEFFVDAARDLIHAYRLARKGDVFGLSDFYRQREYNGKGRKPPYVRVANRWLQWRYAVRPLVYDLEDMLEEFYNSRVEPVIKTVRASHTESVNALIGEGQTSTVGAWHKSREGTVKVSYCATYSISPNVHLWKRLGITNLPALLWELLPGSFMFDWVLPIGNFLSGLDADIGISITGVQRAERHRWGETLTASGGKNSSTVNRYDRYGATLSLPSQPLPVWRTAEYDLKNRMFDVIALLTQMKGEAAVAAARRGLRL